MFGGWTDLALVASSVVFLIIGAMVGYLVGLQTVLARRLVTVQPASPPTAAGTQTAEEFLTAELERCLEAARAIPESQDLAKELKLIVQAVTNLSQRLKHSPDESLADADAIARSLPAVNDNALGAAPRSSTLSTQELQHFTATQAQVASESDNALRRYPYDCYQLVAPFAEDNASPSADSARRVRCHDISGEGISFFWPVEPPFERVLIMLGSAAAPTIMLAKVAHFRPVSMHAKQQFLVGCQFLQRLEHQQPLRQEAELVYGEA